MTPKPEEGDEPGAADRHGAADAGPADAPQGTQDTATDAGPADAPEAAPDAAPAPDEEAPDAVEELLGHPLEDPAEEGPDAPEVPDEVLLGLDARVDRLAWAAVIVAVIAAFVGILEIVSAPLYLVAVVLVALAAGAARKRHELKPPLPRMQFEDAQATLALSSMILFALVASIESLGILSRLGLIEYTVEAGTVVVLAHVVLTAGVALLAGLARVTLGLGELDRPAAPGWAVGGTLALAVAFFLYAVPIGLGMLEGSVLSRTRFEWVFYAGAGLLASQLMAFLVLGTPGPGTVAERVNERLDLATRKRATLSLIAALAIVYAMLWVIINLTLSPVLQVALPDVDPLMLMLPVILVPEIVLVLLTVKEMREAEGKPFYDRTMKLTVIGISAAVSGLMAVLYLLTFTIDWLVILILAATGPYGFYEFARVKHLRKMEEKLPDFLRDLAEYWKGGLSMTDAIDTLSKGEYGELTPEVRKMSVQLSWGVAFSDVLRMFGERVNTGLVRRAVSLVQEANRAGGKIADILMAAANDAREIKWLERERQSNMSIYVAIIYMSFGVFLAVIAIIAAQFLPAIVAATQSLGGSTTIGSVQIKELDRSFVVGLFFASALVQSIGSGMVGGVMGEGEVSAGLKHIFIMVMISYVVFRVLVGI